MCKCTEINFVQQRQTISVRLVICILQKIAQKSEDFWSAQHSERSTWWVKNAGTILFHKKTFRQVVLKENLLSNI